MSITTPDMIRGISGQFDITDEKFVRDDEAGSRLISMVLGLEAAGLWDQKLYLMTGKMFQVLKKEKEGVEFVQDDIEHLQKFCKMLSDCMMSEQIKRAFKERSITLADLVTLNGIKQAIEIHILEPRGIAKTPGFSDLQEAVRGDGSMPSRT